MAPDDPAEEDVGVGTREAEQLAEVPHEVTVDFGSSQGEGFVPVLRDSVAPESAKRNVEGGEGRVVA